MFTHNTHTQSAAKCHILFACREAHFSWEYTELPCIECPGMWSPEDDCSKEFHGLSKKFMRASGAVIYLAHRHFNTPTPTPSYLVLHLNTVLPVQTSVFKINIAITELACTIISEVRAGPRNNLIEHCKMLQGNRNLIVHTFIPHPSFVTDPCNACTHFHYTPKHERKKTGRTLHTNFKIHILLFP